MNQLLACTPHHTSLCCICFNQKDFGNLIFLTLTFFFKSSIILGPKEVKILILATPFQHLHFVTCELCNTCTGLQKDRYRGTSGT